MLDNKKVVVVAAVNGGMQQDREGAKVPTTPEEISVEALECYEAGAAVVHFHARDRQKRNSADPEFYVETITRIREKCPILIQTTNGVGVRRDPATGNLVWPTDAERIALFNLPVRQDLFGIAGGSMDFYNPEGGYLGEVPYINSADLLRVVVPAAFDVGSTIEFEIVEPSCLYRLRRLAEEGMFDPERKNVWLLHGCGFGGTPATPRGLVHSIDEGERVFPNAKWGVVGTGRHMFWVGTLGLALGCDTVRVGLEDGIHLPDGKVARNNVEMVTAIVKLAAQFGREFATPDEARRIFELRSGAKT